jgi:hypothetical protein
VDAATGEYAAQVLTDGNTDGATQAPASLRQAEGAIARVTVENAYDSAVAHPAAAARRNDPPPNVVMWFGVLNHPRTPWA